MSFEPNPQQAQLLLSMLLGETQEQKTPSLSKCGIKDPATRDALVHAELVEKITAPRGRGKVLRLTVQGRRAASLTLGRSSFPKGPKAAALLLKALLQIRSLLQSHENEIARQLDPDSASPEEGTNGHPVDAEVTLESIIEAIRQAYLGLTQNTFSQRVGLKDLRPRLEFQKEDVDQALLALERSGSARLYGFDNPVERTRDAEEAALYVAGNPRHLIYLDR